MGEDSLVARKGVAAFAAALFRVVAIAWALAFLPIAAQACFTALEPSVVLMADADDFGDPFDGLDPCDLPPEPVLAEDASPRAPAASRVARARTICLRAPRARGPPAPRV